jgi:ParB/RepB/Spo0J family partition protein
MSSASSVPAKPPVPQVVAISLLRESPTNPRKYFDKRSLDELAESVRERGILEPLVLRPLPKAKAGELEIVAGARRYRAAKLAGLGEVPAMLFDFSDKDVRLIQLVENGQRVDLTPIEEAEAYAELAAEGLSIAEIAGKLKKRMPDVAKRIPLAKLPKKAKDLMASGVLPVGHAELIARIPDPKLHEEALGRIMEDFWGAGDRTVLGVVPFATAQRVIEAEFMTEIASAPFDPEDATLSPLGPCSRCQHLSGNNRDLFGDVKGRNVCTYPRDFRLKIENHLKRLRENGYAVLLTPKEVKRAFPHENNPHHLAKDFVDLMSPCPGDPKNRTYDALLAPALKLKTVFALVDGRVRQLYPKSAIAEALAASGLRIVKKPKVESKAAVSKSVAQLDRIGQDAVQRELAAKLRSVKLAPSGWIDLLVDIAVVAEGWKLEGVLRRHGYDGTPKEFAEQRQRIVKERIEAMSDAEKRAFLVDLLVGGWIATADKAQQEIFKFVLKLAQVDYAKVANRAIDEAKRKAIDTKPAVKPPIAGEHRPNSQRR